MSLGITVHGPLFDGRAQMAADDACEESERTVAMEGSAMVRARQGVTFKVQTPYYRVRTQSRKARGGYIISGPNVPYGHWLEGTGSRNATTRFKGYFIFRTMAAVLRMRAVAIASPIVRRYVNSRMG